MFYIMFLFIMVNFIQTYMKKILLVTFIILVNVGLHAQNEDCLSVYYTNYKNNEKGLISFCSGNSNTLLINNYKVGNQDFNSAVLLTNNGVEVKITDPSWKKEIKVNNQLPEEKSGNYQGYNVQYVKLTDGNATAKIWFTNQFMFYNSKNYWLFYGTLGTTIESEYSGLFPIALQLIDNSTNQVLYEHFYVDKSTIQLKKEVFNSTK